MTPIVFLPGTLCDERLWQHQTAEFTQSQVVNLRTQNHLEAMVEAVAKIPSPEFILTGFSMGGYVAQEFALRYPERVKHLVLIGSSALGYPPHEKEMVIKSREMIERGLFKGITLKRLREYLHPSSYEKAELRELIQSMAGPDAAEVYVRQLQATLERRDLTRELGTLKCPLTAIGGKQDQVVSAESILSFEKWVKNADVSIFDQCGHFVPLEKPRELNAALYAIVQK